MKYHIKPKYGKMPLVTTVVDLKIKYVGGSKTALQERIRQFWNLSLDIMGGNVDVDENAPSIAQLYPSYMKLEYKPMYATAQVIKLKSLR